MWLLAIVVGLIAYLWGENRGWHKGLDDCQQLIDEALDKEMAKYGVSDVGAPADA